MRKRNVVLESLVQFMKMCPGATIAQFEAFLYICENPGACETDIGHFCKFDRPRASRVIRALEAEDAIGALPPFYGLIEMKTNPLDARSKMINLSLAGRQLQKKINLIIKTGVCIHESPDRPGGHRPQWTTEAAPPS